MDLQLKNLSHKTQRIIRQHDKHFHCPCIFINCTLHSKINQLVHNVSLCALYKAHEIWIKHWSNCFFLHIDMLGLDGQ